MSAQISAQVPTMPTVPSDDDIGLLPPYTVCVVDEDKQDGGDATTVMELLVIYATSIFDTQAPERSAEFKRILIACRRALTGSFRELGMIVSGADVMGTVTAEDKETNSVGVAVRMRVGATDMELDLDGVVNADLSLDGIGAPRRGYSTKLGDGSLRSFTIQHNLGTSEIAYFTLRDAADGGEVYANVRDYRVTIVDDNTLTIDLLDYRTPANDQNRAGVATPGVDGLIFTVLVL